MTRTSGARRAGVGAMLCLVLGIISPREAAGDPARSGWYLAAGFGATRTATTTQAGRNRDTTCYPGNDCSHLAGGAPTGYRWFYDLRTDTGTAFEVAVGRAFGDVRVEASAARRVANVEQVFTGTIYLDGTERVRAADSDYRSTSQSSIEDLTTHTLALNVYRDFPLPERAITPYVGAGLGLSAVKLSGEFYRSRYSCREGRQCEDPGQYDSYVDTAESGTVLSGHVHAGVGYALHDRLMLDLKLSFSALDGFEDETGYVFHKIDGLTRKTEIGGVRQWSLTVGLRYLFRDGI